MILNAEQGSSYEFQLSDGSTLILRFDGFGKWMVPIWVEPATGETIDQLPPYKAYKKVD